jgi:RecA-family ATPase
LLRLSARIDAAGGDPERIHALTEIRYTGEDGKQRTRAVILADGAEIERAVREYHVRLVVIDVLMAYLATGVDSHRDQDVRTVLAQLAAMADRCHCCVLLLRHLTKAHGGNPIYAGGESRAINPRCPPRAPHWYPYITR